MSGGVLRTESLSVEAGGIRAGNSLFFLVVSVAVHAGIFVWFALEGPFQTVVIAERVALEPIAVSIIVLPEVQPVPKPVEVVVPPAPPVPHAILPPPDPPPPTPRPRSATPQVAQPAIPPVKPVASQPLHAVPDTARQDQSAGTAAPLTSVRPASGNPSPRYPGMSRRRGEEGQVVLRVVVGPDGRVVSLSVAQSSGFRRLDLAALDAVRRWRFDPARRGRIAIGGAVRIPIRFVLQ